MNQIERKLGFIERVLGCVQGPIRCKEAFDGLPRSILPNSKIKELKNLYDKVSEAQKLIQEIPDMTEQYVYQRQLNQLEEMRQMMLIPSILVVEDDVNV